MIKIIKGKEFNLTVGGYYANADFSGEDLSNLYLNHSVLKFSNLKATKFKFTKLHCVNLANANLTNANLTSADLSYSYLNSSDLSYADLTGANLRVADLRGANLTGADLINADLTGANLTGVNFNKANLSGAKGLTKASDFLKKFKQTRSGIYVYKAIGTLSIPTSYPPNPNWVIKPGFYLEETVNPNRTNDCGCGVNFGTLEWVQRNYSLCALWLCLIEWKDVADIVVPYNTDGKARCSRLKLVKKLK